jgi:ketosteroid isomerase-like protein
VQEPDLRATVQEYLEAYDRRDLDRCIQFFAEDATIRFAMGTFRGRQAIEEWHKDRFAADMRVLGVDEIRVQNDKVIVDLVAASNTSRAWGFDAVDARVTVTFRQGKVRQAEFGLRTVMPLEGW